MPISKMRESSYIRFFELEEQNQPITARLLQEIFLGQGKRIGIIDKEYREKHIIPRHTLQFSYV